MLEYLALGILILSGTAIFYFFIFIHDLPHRFAKKHNHPQVEAIHYACWLSLLTLHAIWPIVFLWALMKPRSVPVEITGGVASMELRNTELERRILALETQLQGQSTEGGENA